MATAARLFTQTFKDVTIVNFEEARILDTALIQKIGEELYRLVDDMARRKLVLDFTKVQFLSSSALGVLITLQKKATAAKATVVICGMRKELMKVFEIMKIDKLFKFCADERAGLAVFGVTSEG